MKLPLEIARIEEARQANSTAELAADAQPIAGGWMAFDGKGSWANQAAGLGLHGPVSDEELDELVEFFTSRHAEPRIEVCSLADKSLLRGLAKRRFELREFENVLARELGPAEDLLRVLPHGWPSSLSSVAVSGMDEELARSFVSIWTNAYEGPDPPAAELLEQTARKMLTHAPTQVWLGLWDGVPAGCGAVEVAGEVGCLFGGSVLLPWRRRGIQSALIIRRLESARDAGATLGIIHSTPGEPTERNAMRLGFRVAYAKAIMAKSGPGLHPAM